MNFSVDTSLKTNNNINKEIKSLHDYQLVETAITITITIITNQQLQDQLCPPMSHYELYNTTTLTVMSSLFIWGTLFIKGYHLQINSMVHLLNVTFHESQYHLLCFLATSVGLYSLKSKEH
ncbi:hypothetical protein ACTFIV_002977 [Dictyostelium citrinum]